VSGTRTNWYYWRLVATACSFTLFGIGGLVLGYLVFPVVSLASGSHEKATQRVRKLVQLGFRSFVSFMRISGVLTWEIEGEELLAPAGKLIVANHPSLIDIVFLIAMLPNASCIIKPDIANGFFTRGAVRRAGYVSNNSPDQLLNDCAMALQSGASLVVFPEGTRSPREMPGRFQRGAAYIYLKALPPLLLATIQTSLPVLDKAHKWYQIPHRRPHFILHIIAAESDNIATSQVNTAITARALSTKWRDYFVERVNT